MATVEELHLALQAVRVLHNVRKNARENIAYYRRQIQDSDWTVEQVKTILAKDAVNMDRSVSFITRLSEDAAKKGPLVRGLALLGITESDVADAVTQLGTGIDVFRDPSAVSSDAGLATLETDTLATLAASEKAADMEAAFLAEHEDLFDAPTKGTP